MTVKIVTSIRKWLDTELDREFPNLKIIETKELEDAKYYDLQINQFRFCLVVQDLKSGPKLTWIFHREFTDDETDYWKGRYQFKLIDIEGNFTKSIIKIEDIQNTEPVRVVMTRQVTSLRMFIKELKWVLIMEHSEGDDDE